MSYTFTRTSIIELPAVIKLDGAVKSVSAKVCAMHHLHRRLCFLPHGHRLAPTCIACAAVAYCLASAIRRVARLTDDARKVNVIGVRNE